MKIKLLVVFGLVVILSLVFLTGCNSGTPAATTTVAPVVPPASVASPPAAVSSAPISVNVNGQQGIWVNGEGSIMVTPNIANLSLGVSEQAAKVADAQSQAASDMTKVIAALTGNGVDTKDISTQFYNISQLSRYDNTTQQSVVTGFQVTNTVSVTIRNIANVGTIIDAVTVAGGDATRVNSIGFSVDNPAQYYSQVRALAVKDAAGKAAQLASLAGVTLGKATYVSEFSSGPTPPIAVGGVAVAAPGPTTPISPGQQQVTLNIQVAYAIQ